jgi:hypothetical protein
MPRWILILGAGEIFLRGSEKLRKSSVRILGLGPKYCNVDDKAFLGNHSVKKQWKFQCLLVVAEQQTAH